MSSVGTAPPAHSFPVNRLNGLFSRVPLIALAIAALLLALGAPPARAADVQISGTVVSSATDAPLSGMTVEVRRYATSELVGMVTTDADGAFSVAVPPGQFRDPTTYDFRFYDPQGNYQPGYRGVDVELEGVDIGQQRLTPVDAAQAVRFSGKVVGPNGEPVSGAVAEAAILTPSGSYGRAITAADGSFSVLVPRSEATTARISISDPSGAYAAKHVEVSVSGTNVDVGVITLTSIGTQQAAITGRVVDDRRNPIPGMDVRVRIRESGILVSTVVSGADGTFSAPMAAVSSPMNYELVARDPAGNWDASNYVTVQFVNENVSAGDLVMYPKTKGDLTGLVTDSAGNPLAGIAVEAVRINSVSTTTDAQGRYTFTGLEEGGYRLTFTDPTTAHLSQTVNASVSNGTTTVPTVALASNLKGTLQGSMVDQNGEPVKSDEDFYVKLTERSTGASVTTTTDIRGQFSIAVPAGTYTVVFTAPDEDFESLTMDSVTVPAGKITDLGSVRVIRIEKVASTTEASARIRGANAFVTVKVSRADGILPTGTVGISGVNLTATLKNGSAVLRFKRLRYETTYRIGYSGDDTTAESATSVTLPGRG